MQSSSAPAKFPIPFANATVAPYTRPIPQASQIGIQNGAASLTDGFPPAAFSPISAGGSWPWGADFNGLLNQMTAWDRWFQAGGPVFFDATLATAIGGYPKGAMLSSAVTNGLVWISQADNNTTNPDSGGVNWIPSQQWTAGNVSSVSGATIANGVLTIASQQWSAGNVSSVSGGTVAGGVLTIPAGQWSAGAVARVVGATIASGTLTIPSAPAQQWTAGGVSSVSGGTVSGGTLTIPALLPANNTWTGFNTYAQAIAAPVYTTAGTYCVIIGGPGGTIVNNRANTANNLIIDDAGNVSARASLSTPTVITSDVVSNTAALVLTGGTSSAQFNNHANTIANLIVGDGGDINFRGASLTAGGTFNTSASINANGDVTANSGRLRASFGAAGSGDFNAATILNDFPFSISGNGYIILPNGFILQWGVVNLGIAPAQYVGLNIAFPHGGFWAGCSYGSFPSGSNSCGAQANDQFSILIGNAGGGFNQIFWLALGW